jgi:serine/threonine protein kinase/formylglycine-generating enzyme required for sulfatase activity
MPPQPRDNPADRPERIGRYPVLSLLGRGGMGEVYLARDEDLGRLVAIKVLKSKRAQDPVWLARFKREAQAVSSLEHPYIVPVYEFGEDEGRRYFVMRAVDGHPLNIFVKQLRWTARGELAPMTTQRGSAHAATEIGAPVISETADPDVVTTAAPDPVESRTSGGERRTGQSMGSSADSILLDPATPDDGRDIVVVLSLIEKCARALAFAHRHGVLHRDVKPSNIMVDAEGNPQLLDFGLARIVGKDEFKVAKKKPRNAIIGTMPYVAPEHFGGEDDAIDHRADIYALGVTLYECLCGVRPFVADTAEDLMFKIVGREPAAPSGLRRGISRDLETVMLKTLEKDPEHRYQTAEDFAQDLNNLLFLREIDARPVTRTVKIARWANRHPLLALASLFIFITALVLPTTLIVNHFRAEAEAKRVDAYTQHIRLAQAHEVERESLLNAIARQEEELARREEATPRHAPADSPEKRELFAARAELKRDRERAAALAGRMEYELQLSREAVDPHAPDDGERVALYRRLHQAAIAREDRAQIEKFRLFLLAAGEDPDLPLTGQLSLATTPPGASVSLISFETGEDGRRRRVEKSSALGTTPLRDLPLEAGSHLLRIELPGHHPVDYPISISAGEHWGHPDFADARFADRDWTVRLLPVEHHDARLWAQVPRGPYLGGPDGAPGLDADPAWRWVEGFLMARDELTFDDYLGFLDRPATLEKLFAHREAIRRDPASVAARGLRAELIFIPRRAESASPILGVNGETQRIAFPSPEQEPLFAPEVALSGVSRYDADAYIAWRIETRGDTSLRLPRQNEWQKALRGVDGRNFPWGDLFDWSYLGSRHAENRPDSPRNFAHPPRSFPDDCSIYGIFDLAGNVAEWCADGPAAANPAARMTWFCGGAYGYGMPYMYGARAWNSAPWEYVSETLGFRLVRDY